MTVASFKSDLLIMAVFLLIGFFVRERVKIFQKLFFPASLVGGLILLLLGQQCLGWVEVSKTFDKLPGALIDVILASMVFGVIVDKERFKAYLEYSLITMTAYGMQMMLGVLLGAFLAKIWVGLPEGWGVMGVFSFHGGHGTAAAAATQFEALGVEGNMSIGMVISTFGLIVAMTMGMAFVNFGIRRGWGTYMQEPSKQPAYIYGGRLPEEKRASVGKTVVSSININHFAFQFSWLLLAVFLGKHLFKFLGMIHPFFNHMPNVLHGIIGGLIIWFVLRKIKYDYLVDIRTIKQIAGFLLDIVVFAAMATLDLKLVGTYIVPLLVYTLLLSVLTILIIGTLSRLFLKTEWFEKSCMAFGAATGNTSTGLALLRAVDPDTNSSAGDTHGVYSAIMSWKDVFVGLTPMWLAGGTVMGVVITSTVGGVVMVAAFILAYIFRERRA